MEQDKSASSMASRKRNRDQARSPVPKSKAARFNAHTLKRLQNATHNDPEIDLITQMPTDYSARLVEMKEFMGHPEPPKTQRSKREDIRDRLSPSEPAEVIFPISEAVLGLSENVPGPADPLPNGLSQRLFAIMQASEVIWTARFPSQKMVFRCAPGTVVKATRCLDDYTEYTTLQYLHQHKPTIPAPKPLGFAKMRSISLIFMTHMPSQTLESIWHKLDQNQKASISEQLNTIMEDLRSLPYTTDVFGGVGGEGCKDARRQLRKSDKSITSLDEFEDFLFTSPFPGGAVFVELLRQLSPMSSAPLSRVVFTHGDLQPHNIVVDIVGKEYVISGLLDWEYSGFYPEYYEAVRSTNCLAPNELNDWYLFLPECISPKRYSQWWLFDMARERRQL